MGLFVLTLVASLLHLASSVCVGPFHSNYQFEKCTSIKGDLMVSHLNHRSLHNLHSVTGHLFINRTSLNSLLFLNKLERVGGSIFIEYNDYLSVIDTFHALESVGGSIYVVRNPRFPGLTSFTSLTEVGQHIEISHNIQLHSIDFPQLSKIGGSFHIENNPSLNKLAPFNELVYVGTELKLIDNAILFISFPYLQYVGRLLTVSDSHTNDLLFCHLRHELQRVRITVDRASAISCLTLRRMFHSVPNTGVVEFDGCSISAASDLDMRCRGIRSHPPVVPPPSSHLETNQTQSENSQKWVYPQAFPEDEVVPTAGPVDQWRELNEKSRQELSPEERYLLSLGIARKLDSSAAGPRSGVEIMMMAMVGVFVVMWMD